MNIWAKFGLPPVDVERRGDDSCVLRSREPLADYPPCVGAIIERRTREIPERTYLAARDAAGAWRTITYGEAGRAARAVAQALIDRKLGPDRPVLIVAENGIDHALLALGCLLVGVPFAPVSAAYAPRSRSPDTANRAPPCARPACTRPGSTLR